METLKQISLIHTKFDIDYSHKLKMISWLPLYS